MNKLIYFLILLILLCANVSNATTIVYPAGTTIQIQGGIKIGTDVRDANNVIITGERGTIDDIPTYIADSAASPNLISETNGLYQVWIVTNNTTTFGFNRKSAETNDGVFKIVLIQAGGSTAFDATVDGDSVSLLGITNSKPTLIEFNVPAYATNWYAKQIISINETVTTGYEP